MTGFGGLHRNQRHIVQARLGDIHSEEEGCEEDLLDVGKTTCACWLGVQGNLFATGHDTGDVLVWLVPKTAYEGTLQLKVGQRGTFSSAGEQKFPGIFVFALSLNHVNVVCAQRQLCVLYRQGN